MSDINPDSSDAEYNSSESTDDQSVPDRWILLCAIALLAIGVLLLALRSVIFSLILTTIGLSFFVYWLYIGVRRREQAVLRLTMVELHRQWVSKIVYVDVPFANIQSLAHVWN
jgi:hypothetical protein